MKNEGQPCNVYLTLDPQNQLTHICLESPAEKNGFSRFLINNYDAVKQCQVPLTDSHMLCYCFPNEQMIPPLSKENMDSYLPKLMQSASDNKIYPAKIVSIYDMMFCKRYDIPFLSAKAEPLQLAKHSAYEYFMYRLGRGDNQYTYTALNSDNGIMLFSNTEKGNSQLNDCLQYHADMFFKPQYKNNMMERYSILSLDRVVNERCDSFNKTAYERSGISNEYKEIPAFCYCSPEILHYGFKCKEYNMARLPEHYGELINYRRSDELRQSEENFNISSLLYISANGYPKGGFDSTGFDVFTSQHLFDKLDLERSGADTIQEKEIDKHIKELATEILGKDYPWVDCNNVFVDSNKVEEEMNNNVKISVR